MYWSIDGERLSAANARIDFGGTTLRGVQKLSAKESVKRDRMYGNGSISIGVPAGTHEADWEVQTIPEEARALLATLGSGYTAVAGHLGCTFVGSTVYGLLLTRMYINDQSLEIAAGGSSGTLVTIGGYVLDPIDWDGLQAFDAALASQFGFSVQAGPFQITL